MTQTLVEILLLVPTALCAGFVIFVAGVIQGVMNDLDEAAFKRFLILMTSQKVQKRLFARRERASPPPPFEVNSNGPTLTPARCLIAFGLLTDFWKSANPVKNTRLEVALCHRSIQHYLCRHGALFHLLWFQQSLVHGGAGPLGDYLDRLQVHHSPDLCQSRGPGEQRCGCATRGAPKTANRQLGSRLAQLGLRRSPGDWFCLKVSARSRILIGLKMALGTKNRRFALWGGSPPQRANNQKSFLLTPPGRWPHTCTSKRKILPHPKLLSP